MLSVLSKNEVNKRKIRRKQDDGSHIPCIHRASTKVCFFLKYEKIERDITFAFKDLLETVKTFPFLYFMFTLT